ncbi:MAG: FG-GAP-like repeat-containing protein [Bradymonadia bacterium]
MRTRGRHLGVASTLVASMAMITMTVEDSTAQVAPAASWPATDGGPDRARLAQGPARLTTPVIRWSVSVGGRPEAGQVLADDLDGDGTLDLVAIRGGRIEAYTATGEDRWRTTPLGATRLEGLFDFNLDGRQELLVVASESVRLLDALNGEVLWTTPAEPFTRIGRVMVRDLDGDGFPELYVADRACGSGGRGPGITFDFAEGLFSPRTRATTDNEARTYVCGIHQSFGDINGDGELDLIVPDNAQVHAFDPLTGARVVEGADLGPLQFGVVPHATADVDGDGDDEVVGFIDNDPEPDFDGRRSVILLDFTDGRLRPRWEALFPVGDVIEPASGAVLPIGEGNGPAIVVNHWSEPDGQWFIRSFDLRSGAALPLLADHRLMGVADLDGDGRPELVTRTGDGQAPERFGDVAVYDADLTPLFSRPSARVLPTQPQATDTARTREARQILAIARPAGGEALVVARDADDDNLVDRIETIGADGGALGAFDLVGTPGAFTRSRRPLLDPMTPTGGLGVWALADGRLGAWSADLTLTNAHPDGPEDVPGPQASGGTPRVVAADPAGTGTPRPIAVASDGRVVSFESTGLVRWATALNASGSTLEAGQLNPGGPVEIVVDDGRTPSDAAYVALNGLNGNVLWRHSLPADEYTARPPALVADLDGDGAAEVVRYDVRISDDVRVITALNGNDGSERWVSEVPVTALALSGQPSAQTFEGETSLYFPDALQVYAISADGILSGASRSNQTGGVVRPTGGTPPLIRAEGARPLLTLSEPRFEVWQADANGVPNSAWVGRNALPLPGREVWVSPQSGAPIERLRLSDGVSVGQIGLGNGAALPPPFDGIEDVRKMTAVPDLLGDGALGVSVTTDAGRLYAVTAEGLVGWSRSFNTELSDVAWADVDDDGEVEAIVGLGDGTLAMLDQAQVDAPESVWDNNGEGPAGSDADDIDLLFSEGQLGADWTEVPGADAYEIRLLGPNDTVIRPWRLVGDETFSIYEGVSLIPGSIYFTEVRALVQQGNGVISRSAPTRSDGVQIGDEQAPMVTISADPDVLLFGQPRSISLQVEASDEDRLAALRIEIFASGSETLVRRVLIRPLGGALFSGTAVWSVDDLDDMPVPPGLYRARASVDDRASNQAQDEVQLVICDEAQTVDPRCELESPDMDLPDMMVDAGMDPDVEVDPEADMEVTGEFDAEPDDDIGAEGNDEVAGSDSCDCRAGSGGGPFWPLMLLALGMRLRRRRR